MDKNNAIGFWRIIFTYLIAMFHFNTIYPWMVEVGIVPGWYIGVEFFFLVSGYLLYARFDDYVERFHGPVGFSAHRFARIWPEYIVVFFVMFACEIILEKTKLSPLERLWDCRYEILLLQGIGIARGWDWINPILWYLSVMILAGFLIFALLRYMPRFFVGYLAPALIIISLFLLYENVGKLDAAMMPPGEVVNYPLLRGIAEMSLGVYACKLNGRLRGLGHGRLFHAAGALCMLSAIWISTFYGGSRWDFICLLLLFFGVAAAFLPIERNPVIVERWASVTFEIYLLHGLFRSHIFPYFYERKIGIDKKLHIMVLYLLAVTAAAVVLKLVQRKIDKHTVDLFRNGYTSVRPL